MLLTTADALNPPEDAPSSSSKVGSGHLGTAVTVFSPTSEPASTTSPREGQRKADSAAHLSASGASGVTTRTVGKEGDDPYWVVVVVLIAVVLIITLAASFPYVSKVSRQQCKQSSCRQLSVVLRESIDPSVRACDNFYRHVCNGWVAKARRGRTRKPFQIRRINKYEEQRLGNEKPESMHDDLDAPSTLRQTADACPRASYTVSTRTYREPN
ncbi:hypothetical protein HPB50_019095 [Hyalomma asiaticum]|uniref:Uncharacterized protein n=1 Tax=Hyalomma asiaticum TaxID=266040 RepID=A0ACB7T3I1_HYAAI|nr:hypothetical protein HPB50_019095 [Hyalomma asiaticum]